MTPVAPSSAPAAPRIRPIETLSALRRLLRDPDDTEQVFIIGEALRGRSLARATARFGATPIGAAVLAGRHALLPLIADRAALARLPEASVGRAYLAFVEGENLSAEGLAEAARQRDLRTAASADEQAFRAHIRDAHDLWHVLTGYGRDPLGEVCLLAFTYAQTRFNGLGVIALLGGLRIGRELRGLPVRAALREGYGLGRRVAWLPAADWASLLSEPLVGVRERLGITPPATYAGIVGNLAPERLRAAPLH